jgi:glyoxylase-like metal-dependent hydrolase (beta-lactamase superfamily II)/8-oxo-dGTP pyrophosphatase MutT (NUDIX family)
VSGDAPWLHQDVPAPAGDAVDVHQSGKRRSETLDVHQGGRQNALMTERHVVDPRPAATVVLVRPGAAGLEVLLTHRPATMAFAPDMHVFPGGRVDTADADTSLAARSVLPADAAAERLGGDLQPETALAAHVAAIREAFEEVGVLLADHAPGVDLVAARSRLLADAGAFPSIAEALDLRLRTDLLVPLSRWVTPASMPRRFDARFFAAAFPAGAAVTLVGDEVSAQAWHRPSDALESMAAGALGMWLPTSTTLMQLAHAQSIEDIEARLAPGRLGEVVVEDVVADVVRIEMPAAGGVAGQPVNAYLVGRAAFVLVDPGDPTGDALDRAVSEAEARGGRVVAVALTHADPDHAAGAEAVAEQLGVPVLVGPGGGRHLPYETREVDEGEVIDVGDVALRVMATPGPRPDHVAFIVGEGSVVIAGDLEGGRGARSILGPPDEGAWQRSVAALRSAAPGARWLPGHGPPVTADPLGAMPPGSGAG